MIRIICQFDLFNFFPILLSFSLNGRLDLRFPVSTIPLALLHDSSGYDRQSLHDRKTFQIVCFDEDAVMFCFVFVECSVFI